MPSNPDVSARSRVSGLPVVVLALLVVAGICAAESVNGLQTVVSTAGTVAAVLVPATVVAVGVRRIAGRTAGPWPGRGLAALAVISVALVVVVVVVTYRAHSASERFADDAARLPLPAGYTSVPAQAADAQHSGEPEHTMLAWRVPSGADACADIKRAFTAWSDDPVESFSRGTACAVASNDSDTKSELHVSPDHSTVVLELWLEGSSLIHF